MSDKVTHRASTPAELLREAAQIYEQRSAVYGDNYKHMGTVLVGLFPRGLTLSTYEEFNRFHLFLHVLNKVSRYAQNLKKGGHADSLDDLSVYAMMLREDDKRWAPQEMATGPGPEQMRNAR